MDEVGLMFLKTDKTQGYGAFFRECYFRLCTRLNDSRPVIVEVSLRDDRMYTEAKNYFGGDDTTACPHIRPNHLLLYWRTDE